ELVAKMQIAGCNRNEPGRRQTTDESKIEEPIPPAQSGTSAVQPAIGDDWRRQQHKGYRAFGKHGQRAEYGRSYPPGSANLDASNGLIGRVERNGHEERQHAVQDEEPPTLDKPCHETQGEGGKESSPGSHSLFPEEISRENSQKG